MLNSFSATEFLNFCKSKDYNDEKWKKKMKKYLKSQDFYGWLFNPPKSSIADYSGLLENIYGSLCEDPDKLSLLIDMLDENAGEFGRATSAFLYSVVNYGIDTANAAFKSIEERYAAKEITRSEAEKKNKNVEKYCELINEIDDAASKIVKRDAKKLAIETNLPKAVCKMALKQVPDPIFITNNKVGIYLNMILSNLYQIIDKKDCDISDIKWKRFFDKLFGEENQYEVASFILLETPNHINNLSSKSVRKVWDGLTAYSLNRLEKASYNDRSQMIEIYLKRLAKAISTGDMSVRVDLRSLSEKEYPELTKTISRYADKFDEAFKPLTASNIAG